MKHVSHDRVALAAGAGVLAAAVAVGAALVPAAASAVPAHEAALDAPTIRSPHDLTAPTVRSPKRDGGQSETGKAGSSAARAALPGVGAKNMAKLPSGTKQAIVAYAPKQSGNVTSIAFYERSGKSWKLAKKFSGHNGEKGWTTKHKEGDLRTPSGVFALTDAGGSLKNPGTKMPYSRDSSLKSSAAGAYGDSFRNVFDYVVAINYNRKAGKPPQDSTRPDGWGKGGGIWLHLDHDAGTHGCVTLPRADLKWVLRKLDPKAKPYIVMGSAADIAK